MNKNRLVLSLLIVLAMFAFGCAAGGSIQKTSAMVTPLESFKTVTINVSNKDDMTQEEMSSLKAAIAGELSKSGKWSAAAADGEINLNVTVTSISRVSTAGRLMFGGLAGRAGLKADVVVTKANGEKMTEYSVEGKSGGGTVFAGGTGTAIEETAKQIVAGMKS